MDAINFIGNTHIIDSFKNALLNNKLSHIYLINAPANSGKKYLATLLSQLILCDKLNCDISNIPCNKCKNCQKVLNNTHPDIISISNNDNSSIQIDEVRALIKGSLHVLPNEANYSIFKILNAEKLTNAAANAFLKTLENPPKHSIFILTTNNTNNIPQTIISRAIIYTLNPLSEIDTINLLTKIFQNIEPLKIYTEYKNHNNYHDTLYALKNSSNTDDTISKIIDQLINKDIIKLSSILATLKENRNDIINMLTQTKLIFQNYIKSQLKLKKNNVKTDCSNIVCLDNAINKLNKNCNIKLTLTSLINDINKNINTLK